MIRLVVEHQIFGYKMNLLDRKHKLDHHVIAMIRNYRFLFTQAFGSVSKSHVPNDTDPGGFNISILHRF